MRRGFWGWVGKRVRRVWEIGAAGNGINVPQWSENEASKTENPERKMPEREPKRVATPHILFPILTAHFLHFSLFFVVCILFAYRTPPSLITTDKESTQAPQTKTH